MSDPLPGTIAAGWRSPKAAWLLLLKVGVAVFLFFVIYKSGLLNFEGINQWHLTSRAVLSLGCGGAFMMGALVVLAWRLILLLAVQDLPIQFRRAFVITVVCNLVGAVLPGIVAGDITKVACLSRIKPGIRSQVAVVVLLDRLIGLYSLLVLGSIAAGLAALSHLAIRHEILWLAAVGMLLGTVGLLVLIEISHRTQIFAVRRSGIFQLVGRIASAFAAYRGQPVTVVIVLVLSVASHALTVGAFVCSAIALSDTLPLAVHFVLDPLAMLLNAVPLTPGGLGLAEGAFAFLFASMGSQNGALIGLTGRFLLYAVSASIGLIALLTAKKTKIAEPAINPPTHTVKET